jgi:SPOR domain/Tetratricopeptide repeat/WD40-like Beta Propeller Repeat
MKFRLLILLLNTFIPFFLAAQGDLVRTAERLYNEGKYADAAEYYERAWRTKTDRQELIYKAGECYYWIKDYRKAIDCYQSIKYENEKFDLVGLKYARSLKQDGRYREAIEEFKWFARDYKGPKKDQLDKIMVNDIKGCELGIELATSRKPKELPVDVQLLPEWVNSIENEFAPIAFSDDLLYFSSMVAGKAKLFRTNREDGAWLAPVTPQGLPEMAAEHFGNGTFSPDGTRFYFTQCNAVNLEVTSGNGLRAQCEIFVTRRKNGAWSDPERLRDYINPPKSTNTHPFVLHEQGKEWLFFASDRNEGMGGMDIYVCERPLDADEIDFSFPQNLGEKINTGGDEITPFFDAQTQTLYFSSNGLISIGGMDVFKTIRSGGKWTMPENLGVPYNSTADDFFFSLKKSGNGGFFVSNRMYGRAKGTTRHEDIFEFFPKEIKYYLSGKIFDGAGKLLLKDCEISLYENSPDAEPRLLQVRPSTDGNFKFPILTDRNYSLEINKEGYETLMKKITPQYAAPQGFDITITLLPQKVNSKSYPNENSNTSVEPLKNKKKKDKKEKKEKPEKTESPVKKTSTEGVATYYKVQLEAQPRAEVNDARYDIAREGGTVETEFIDNKNLFRVLVGDFLTKKEANAFAQKMRDSQAFPQAFIVKYPK